MTIDSVVRYSVEPTSCSSLSCNLPPAKKHFHSKKAAHSTCEKASLPASPSEESPMLLGSVKLLVLHISAHRTPLFLCTVLHTQPIKKALSSGTNCNIFFGVKKRRGQSASVPEKKSPFSLLRNTVSCMNATAFKKEIPEICSARAERPHVLGVNEESIWQHRRRFFVVEPPVRQC